MTNELDPWGGHASTYDRVFAPLTGTVARSLFTLCEARLGPDAQILDVACGSGALLRPALSWAERQQAAGGAPFVVGADFSGGMVAVSQRNLGRLHPSTRFRCETQDGQALTYADASFDAVFSCFGIFLFADRLAGWREAARVLRPGGVFATSTWFPPDRNPMFQAQFGPVFEALPERVKAQHQQKGPPGWLRVADAEPLRAEVTAAGFDEVCVHPFHTTLALASVDDAWQAMRDNPGAGGMIQACDDQERKAVYAALRKGLAPYATPSGAVLLEARCHLLTARRAPA